MHLVGRDDQRAVFRHILGHHLAELALRRDIESIGRLVHQQHLRAGSKGEAHKHLLFLTHREGIELQVGGEFKILQTSLQYLTGETRIERLVDFHIRIKRHRGQVELLGYDEDLLQRFRQTLACFNTIKANRALPGTKQSADQIQQRRFTRTVLTQQAIDIILLQRQTEIIEYQVFLTCILETDVTYFNHNSFIIFCPNLQCNSVPLQ